MDVGGEGDIYLSLHCHHQNDFCIKVGSDESRFNVSVGSDGQSHKTVYHKPQPFWRERRAEAVSNRGPSAYQPNALPLGQTGSRSSFESCQLPFFMLILFSFCLLFPCFLLLEAPFSWLVMTRVFGSVFVDGEIDCVDYVFRAVFSFFYFPLFWSFCLLSGLMQHWICEWSLQGVLLFLGVGFGHGTVLGLLIFCVSYFLHWCIFVVHFLVDSVKEIWCSNWWWCVWERKFWNKNDC